MFHFYTLTYQSYYSYNIGIIVTFISLISNALNLPYIFSAQKICDFINKPLINTEI